MDHHQLIQAPEQLRQTCGSGGGLKRVILGHDISCLVAHRCNLAGFLNNFEIKLLGFGHTKYLLGNGHTAPLSPVDYTF